MLPLSICRLKERMPERYQFFVTSLTCRLQSGGGVHQDEVGCRISKNAQSFNAFHD